MGRFQTTSRRWACQALIFVLIDSDGCTSASAGPPSDKRTLKATLKTYDCLLEGLWPPEARLGVCVEIQGQEFKRALH